MSIIHFATTKSANHVFTNLLRTNQKQNIGLMIMKLVHDIFENLAGKFLNLIVNADTNSKFH